MTTLHVARGMRRMLRACALLAALTPASAGAQIAVDKLELFLKPGTTETRSGVLLVRNEGTERAQALVKLEDWDRAADGTNRFFAAGTQPGSCAEALQVFPATLSLAPGESQAVRVALDSTSAAGMRAECWSVVVVQAQQPVKQAGGRTLVYTVRTGMKVYAMPDGLQAEGEVTDVRVAPASSAKDAPHQALVTFRNTGALHLAAQGRIEIRREDNSLVASVPLPPMHVLPGAESVATVKLPACAPGRYMLLAIVDYGGAELAAAQLEHEVP